MTRQGVLAIAKPILFNTEMVRAILEGHKTATRRVIKPQPHFKLTWHERQPGKARLSEDRGTDFLKIYGCASRWGCDYTPPYKTGDVLYVRETWRMQNYGYDALTKTYAGQELEFRADFADIENEMYGRRGGCAPCKWRPSIHMPKKAARIFLQVTDVRAERLQDITEEQSQAEGATPNVWDSANETYGYVKSKYIRAFNALWNKTVKRQDLSPYSWNANPWVWVIEFERVVAGE